MDLKAQDIACEQLQKLLSSSSTWFDKITLAGGVEMISDAMLQHPDKAVVQAEAFTTIAHLVWVKPNVPIKLAHAGVVQNIIHCMETFPTNAKVQMMGCGAFHALSYERSNTVVVNNSYGITTTLNSIKRNPRKLAVHKEACIFIQNMFVPCPDVVTEKILAADIMDTLLASLCKEVAEAELRVTILKLITNLTIETRSKKAFAENESVISSIVIEVQRSDNTATVRQAACKALESISYTQQICKNGIIKAGGVDAVMDAVRVFPDDTNLLDSAFCLLSALINDNKPGDAAALNDFVTNHDGKGILLAAMTEHANTTTAQVAACGVIKFLTFENTSEDETRNTKLAVAALSAMKTHSESVAVRGSPVGTCDPRCGSP